MGRISEAFLNDSVFDGSTYEPARDYARLSGQLLQVKQVLSDRKWHTLSEIAQRIGGSEAGISARIRDLRKPKFGNHKIDRQHIGGGLWRYRIAP